MKPRMAAAFLLIGLAHFNSQAVSPGDHHEPVAAAPAECPKCQGKGYVVIGGGVCDRCKGSGLAQVASESPKAPEVPQPAATQPAASESVPGAARARAILAGPKPDFIHFTDTVNCGPCRKAAADFLRPDVAKELAKWDVLIVDRSKEPELYAWYYRELGIPSLPTDTFYGRYGWAATEGWSADYVGRLRKAYTEVTTPREPGPTLFRRLR